MIDPLKSVLHGDFQLKSTMTCWMQRVKRERERGRERMTAESQSYAAFKQRVWKQSRGFGAGRVPAGFKVLLCREETTGLMASQNHGSTGCAAGLAASSVALGTPGQQRRRAHVSSRWSSVEKHTRLKTYRNCTTTQTSRTAQHRPNACVCVCL